MKKTLLVVLDGFGVPSDLSVSAIQKDNTKFIESLKKTYPNTTLFASEEYVGLPKTQPGTSEVGHATIGAGRVMYQPLVRINKDIESGELFRNKTIVDALSYAKENGKKVHLIGITSDGGIHSHINHLLALIKMCKEFGNDKVFIHFVGDGRDTNPKSAVKYLKQVDDCVKTEGVGVISSIVGRFYAFDRDKNYDRNKIAYDLWVRDKGKKFDDYEKAIAEAYKNGETDEFLTPILLDENGKVENGDVIISYNFRSDRERQLAYVMAEENDLDFTEKIDLKFVCMTEYDENFKNVPVAYRTEKPNNILSQVLSENNVKQAKIAETEKYAHLTFFFNSGKQDNYKNEDRFLISSEKKASYASCPEMSAEKIANKFLEIVDNYDFVAINFANCDMVGHSGDKEATMRAVKIVDEQLKRVVEGVLLRGGQGIVTADHGNADVMAYPDGSPNTSHTTAKVPVIVFGAGDVKLKDNLSLDSIAPTLLEMMNIPCPEDMTGESLIEKEK